MKKKWRTGLLLTLLVDAVCTLPAMAQMVDVAVVVNNANHVRAVTLGELRKIFAGERRSWAVGLPIRPVVRAPGSHERLVLLKVLGMSEHEYKQYWIQQVFRGEAEAEPLTLPSSAMQGEAVSVFPGAITFVEVGDVKPGMKIITVNGRLPGETGYPPALRSRASLAGSTP